ncbi:MULTISPECIES: glycogen/starch/alpha-glucan phosphorylase [Vagococcus]|uniref:Alpha-1,4 glucan phosphorylase n=1 Tax=Vagococcus fluvialis bH819 TaxID=1255619 RepID=A0A1X6WNC2_9ENTE|nr:MULTISPECIES: glycogen/starch/alpha-glucan phosphorylase [Vagococcus]SLM85823.1 Glycogen phosphorylase [Vagococcus fluvialis bH819]HCM90245.1 glycogen/starch/alpha-glucan phosphorylase [Vagococcus sp.]
MTFTKKEFKIEFKERLQERFALSVSDASSKELYETLGKLVTSHYSGNWKNTRQGYLSEKQKQVFYFSIEFLPGRMLKSNLLNLGILDVVEEGLSDLGIDLEDLVQEEPDMALGNGGLGRLASCFMDSLASIGMPGNGNGIRYEYGLFKQRFVDGYQVELPDEWLNRGNIWEVRRESKAVNVHFGGKVDLIEEANGQLKPIYRGGYSIKAIPYDTGMTGFENDTVNTMRLWSAEVTQEDKAKFQNFEGRQELENLTSVLYPDDSNEQGRRFRLSQEYFFVSAGMQSIFNYYKTLKLPMIDMNKYIAIHINDTHPAMCVAELMRLLVDEENMSWEKAWDVTSKVMSYTNHTIMSEALEKWQSSLMKEVCPRIFQIIEEIDRRYVEEWQGVFDDDLIKRTRIIRHDQIHMAHLAIIGSHSVNGVAKLHSDLLKSVVLKDFYAIYPERFNNKTNGIAQRRWSQLSNPMLSKTLDEYIGKSWRKDTTNLRLLLNHQDNNKLLSDLEQTKFENKKKLAAYIKEHNDVTVSPNAIFDIQIKRLHAYKRQLMNLMHIIKLYLDLKENPELDITPRVFMFGAKAAPSYHFAKSVIKLINETANLINNDLDIQDKIKVVFLENYNVSLAELIIPAADVSEQISLASKEASGTSNMKFMLNGAITLATLDGANIEIRDAVGEENIAIFGLTESEVYRYYNEQNYNSADIYHNNPVINRVVNAFVDGTIPNCCMEGQEIFDSLITYNDEFFVLRDFMSYCDAQAWIDASYKDTKKWGKMSLNNIAHAGHFSADDTVRKYSEDIWQIEPIRKG